MHCIEELMNFSATVSFISFSCCSIGGNLVRKPINRGQTKNWKS
uniref:Uncharacterized protein n=1 Tax=Rhizophora mucronata TaxID=61149 RepID=A0A2P2NES6_RHIMU